MDPDHASYTDSTVGDGYCFWYRVGAVDWSKKTVQLLVADGKTGASTVVSGGIGTTATVGRFNIRIVTPMGMWPGSHDTFDVAVYGA